MVRDLLRFVPYKEADIIMDAGSGIEKVWFNSVLTANKMEMEIKEGKDYLTFKEKVDWTIGNPPYYISWLFTKKALETSRKGIAWLLNLNNLNSLFTPKRLSFAKEKGFEITKIHIVNDSRWFGRYFFVVYEKKKGILTWKRETY